MAVEQHDCFGQITDLEACSTVHRMATSLSRTADPGNFMGPWAKKACGQKQPGPRQLVRSSAPPMQR
eukprot:scaffold59512_cov13-Tisochrysis_lutea.AAC.2